MTTPACFDRNGRAALTVGAAALCASFVPLWIHLTVEDIDPFVFNMIAVLSMMSVSGLFLILTKKRFVDRFLVSRHGNNSLRAIASHFSYLERNRSDNKVRIRSAQLTNPRTWFKTPLLWLVVSSLEFGL